MPPTPTSIEQFLRGSAPRWDAIDFDVTCARCGYNLRGLETPRCPECGLEFDWRSVLDAHFNRNPFLFEHNWRQRPIRSYLKTLWMTLRPRKFWSRLSLHERVHAKPLWFVLLTIVPLFQLLLHITAFLIWQTITLVKNHGLFDPTIQFGNPSYLLFSYGSGIEWSDYFNLNCRSWALSFRAPSFWYFIWCGALTITLAALFTLLVSLRQTLGRCRVRSVQILRAAAYSALPIALGGLGLFYLLNAIDAWLTMQWQAPTFGLLATCSIGLLLLAWAIITYCVGIPLKHYLRLPRPWTLAATSSGVAVIFSFTLYMLITVGW